MRIGNTRLLFAEVCTQPLKTAGQPYDGSLSRHPKNHALSAGFFLVTFMTNSWELNFLRLKFLRLIIIIIFFFLKVGGI